MDGWFYNSMKITLLISLVVCWVDSVLTYTLPYHPIGSQLCNPGESRAKLRINSSGLSLKCINWLLRPAAPVEMTRKFENDERQHLVEIWTPTVLLLCNELLQVYDNPTWACGVDLSWLHVDLHGSIQYISYYLACIHTIQLTQLTTNQMKP